MQHDISAPFLTTTQAHLLDAHPDASAAIVSSDAQQPLVSESCFNREKWLSRAIFFQKIYFIFAAGVTGYSITTDRGLVDSLGLAPYFALVTIWNKTDVVRAALEAPEVFRALRDECTTRNFFHASLVSYALLIESSATIWASYSAIQSAQKEGIANVLFVSKDTLGDDRISALATASFGVNALLSGILLLIKQEKSSKDAIEFFAHLTCVFGATTGAASMFAEKFYLYLSTIFYSVSAILHNLEYMTRVMVVLMHCCGQDNRQSANDVQPESISEPVTRSASTMTTIDGDDNDDNAAEAQEPTQTQAALIVVSPATCDDLSAESSFGVDPRNDDLPEPASLQLSFS